MSVENIDPDWAAYNDHQMGREVRALCREVIAIAGDGAGRLAIDFCAGAGVEARALLEAGWHVYAIDAAPGTRNRILKTTGDLRPGQLTIDIRDVQTLTSLPPADLCYAGYSLPFVHPDLFPRVWTLVRNCLRPGAWLAVDLFGDRDAWAGNREMTFFNEPDARALFAGLETVSLTEEEGERPSFGGPKYWHLLRVVARMPP